MDLALQRLAQQRLLCNPLATPAEAVAWLGAVQAQDYAGAKWALAMRLQAATDEELDQAFNEGSILRTHMLRPTWHFVTPADIGWMQTLTAPRVQAGNAGMYRKNGLDAALLSRCAERMARALQGGRYLTRAELGQALAEAGIQAEGQRLGLIVMHAELQALLCSGPRRGKQFTYALLEERAPRARSLPRDEALAELTRRYFSGHGPATLGDFTWWSGLTAVDARAGLALAAPHLVQAQLDGHSYWFPAGMPPVVENPLATTFLLPTYDEFQVGYSGFGRNRRGGRDVDETLAFDAAVVSAGQTIGSWRRTFQQCGAVIELAPFEPLSPAQLESIGAAARRYGEFMGMPVELAGIL